MKEGVVATANTVAVMLSSLPPTGRPLRIMIYDIHTLQNRFYFSGHALADTVTTVPLLLRYINAYTVSPTLEADAVRNPECAIDTIAFPDEGAMKRFGNFFPGFPQIICGKIRDGDKRIVKIHEGDAKGKRILIVDDMVRSGGTICEAAKVPTAAHLHPSSAFVWSCTKPQNTHCTIHPFPARLRSATGHCVGDESGRGQECHRVLCACGRSTRGHAEVSAWEPQVGDL